MNFRIRGALENSRLGYPRAVDEDINWSYRVCMRLGPLLAASTEVD